MVGVVFITRGGNDLNDPVARGKNIGLSKGFTLFLGAAELAGSLGVIFRCAQATGGFGPGRGYAGSDLQKDFCLAHRILGRKDKR